jgi:hypothetical protein
MDWELREVKMLCKVKKTQSPSSFAAAVDCNLVFCFTFLLENGCIQFYCNTLFVTFAHCLLLEKFIGFKQF